MLVASGECRGSACGSVCACVVYVIGGMILTITYIAITNTATMLG